MAGKKARRELTYRNPHGAAEYRRRRGMAPFEGKGGVFQLLGGLDQCRASSINPQPLRQSVEQRRTAKGGLERGETPADRRLTQPERSPCGPQRAVPRDRQKDASVIPIHLRPEKLPPSIMQKS